MHQDKEVLAVSVNLFLQHIRFDKIDPKNQRVGPENCCDVCDPHGGD